MAIVDHQTLRLRVKHNKSYPLNSLYDLEYLNPHSLSLTQIPITMENHDSIFGDSSKYLTDKELY